MGPVKRARISSELVERLTTALIKGDSAAVIGPRHIGKAYLLNQTARALQNTYNLQVYSCSFYRDYPIQEEKEAVAHLRAHLPFVKPEPTTVAELFACVQELSNRNKKSTVLFLTHLDGVASNIARLMLREIRPAVQWKPFPLVVLLSGESKIWELVSGPGSDFNCSHEYLVQGFDRSLFREIFHSWARELRTRVKSEKDIDYIWKLTGGNISLLRRFLYSWINGVVSGAIGPMDSLDKARIDASFERLVSLGVYGSSIFQWASELISSDPSCWPVLEELQRRATAKIDALSPTTLELAGAAEFRDGTLRPTSPTMRNFLRRQFGPRQMADLYAQAGNWKCAFERYQKVGHGYPRPASFQDELTVTSIIKRLSEAFRLMPLSDLRDSLERGLTGMLGFPSVSWWQRNATGAWEPCSAVPAEMGARVIQALSHCNPKSGGSTIDVENMGAATLLPGTRPGSYESCVILELLSTREPSPKRRELLKELLTAFAAAYCDKLELLKRVREEQIPATLAAISARAYGALFVATTSPLEALDSTARDLYLSSLGFETVACCVLSQDTGTIRAVACESSTHGNKLPDWKMDFGGIVPNAFREGFQFVGPGAAAWTLEDRELFGVTDGHSALALPLKDEKARSAAVLLLIYRADVHPELDERKLLISFAEQLSAAMQQASRVALLGGALDRIPEPIVVFDNRMAKKYANDAASKLLQISEHWDSHMPRTAVVDGFLPQVRQSISGRRRLVQFIDRIGVAPYRGAILTDALMADGSVIGGLLHAQDETYYRQLIDAYKSLEEARTEQEALQRLQAIFQELGHRWIRKYGIQGNDLVLENWIEDGKSMPVPELALRNSGRDSVTWKCIVEHRPSVFCFDRKRPYGQEFHTDRGLQVTATPDPPGQGIVPKHEGDYWLDFPLMRSKDDVFGKLTLPCGQDLTPERFEMFCVFSDIAGDSFKRAAELDDSRRSQLGIDRLLQQTRNRLLRASEPLDVILASFRELSRYDAVEGTSLLRPTNRFGEYLIEMRQIIRTMSIREHGSE